jgi:putative FmdB family regulatory protein
MPNYAYACRECGENFKVTLSYAEYDRAQVRCPRCESQDVVRRLGRVRFTHSADFGMESLSDPEAMAELEENPRAMGRMMRQMGKEFGDELGQGAERAEFNEVVERLEAGQTPEQIEKDLPDLGGDL